MSHKLRMSAEIGDWLTELCADDVAAAAEVGAAILALLESAQLPGPALVTDPAVKQAPALAQQAAALEAAQQNVQWALRLARAAATEAATDVRRAAHDVRQLEQQPHHDHAELAARRRRLAGARLLEQKATEHSDRSGRDADAFRARAEAAKARFRTALAARDLHAGLAAARPDGSSTASEEAAASADGVARAALCQLRALLAEAPGLVRRITDGASATALAATEPGQPDSAAATAARQPGSPLLAPGLLELRADPLGSDIRLLFAMEPADTVRLLAVLEGEGAIRVHLDRALCLAGDLLAEIRSGEWPPPRADAAADVELAFDDSAAFLERFFSGTAADIRLRAAARVRANTLAELRGRRGLSLAGLAEAAGIPAERLWYIEDSGLRSAHVREATACVRALGGRLDLSVTFPDGESVPFV